MISTSRRTVIVPLVFWPLMWLSAAHCASSVETARTILDLADCQGGLVVHLDCGDGRLTAALRADDRYLVHGFDTRMEDLEKARKHILSQDLGGKVYVQHWAKDRLPYAENMVNLLVSETPDTVRQSEAMRVLVPGGVLCFKRGGRWEKTVKPWPDNIDEWTHWLHAADGNAVARDTVVGPPRRMQWTAEPTWSRDHDMAPSVTNMVSSGGRVFYIVDAAPPSMAGSAPDKWSLVARDAFNGLPLWHRDMPDWGWKSWSSDWKCRFTIPTHIARRLVSIGDRVYATLGFNEPLSELDASTGKTLRTFKGTEFTDEILHHEGMLIVAINKEAQRPGAASNKRRGETGEPAVRKWVAAIDVASGKTLWKTGDFVGLRSKTGSMERISHLSMCIGDGQVFFVDGQEIISLSLKEGQELWRVPRPIIPEHRLRYDIRFSDMCTLVYYNGAVYFAQVNPAKRVSWRGVRARVHAMSTADGKELWNRECASWGWGHPADVFAIDGLIWVHDFTTSFVLGLDPAGGQIKRKLSNLEAFDNGHHHRCYRNKATSNFLITSYRGLEYIDIESGKTDLHHWVRGTCRLGVMPCNGLTYATPHPCGCYISSKLNGFAALAGQEEPGSYPRDLHKLQRGPAYEDASLGASSEDGISISDDWPMYRRDAARGGMATASLSAELKKSWQVDLGGRVTSCVSVGDTILTALPDLHQIVALNAADGKRLWTFTAGGSVDTPPTVDGGGAYFGCADGWLYCLRVSDGRLAWRFRGAPQDRLIGAADEIQSAWPIHGSPLVRNGIVYFTAGRSSFLDGGIIAFAINAASGKIVSREKLASSHTMKVDKGTSGKGDTGLLSDLLVGCEDSIYMRQRRIFPPTDSKANANSKADFLRSTAGLLDDNWFSRVRWHLGNQPIAEYMVFDSKSIYAVKMRERMSGYGGHFTPGKKGYELFAADRKPLAVKTQKGKKGLGERWSVRVPVRINAMTVAGKTLLAAGVPDVIDPVEPWAAYEGKRGGKLLLVSTTDGKAIAEHELHAPPVLDGLIVAGGRLLIATVDGNIVCFE